MTNQLITDQLPIDYSLMSLMPSISYVLLQLDHSAPPPPAPSPYILGICRHFIHKKLEHCKCKAGIELDS